MNSIQRYLKLTKHIENERGIFMKSNLIPTSSWIHVLHLQMTLRPSCSGVGLLSRWGLPAWVRIPQVSFYHLRCILASWLEQQPLRKRRSSYLARIPFCTYHAVFSFDRPWPTSSFCQQAFKTITPCGARIHDLWLIRPSL